MQFSTTFRHMDTSQAVRDYAEERLDRIRRYFHKDPIAAHGTFAVERGFNHVADLQLTLPNGLVLKAKETTEDMYSSIDLAAARIERQVRKWKDRIRDHKPHGGLEIPMRQRVFSEDAEGPAAGKRGKGKDERRPRKPTPPPAPGYSLVKEQSFTARPMRVDDAIMQMNLLGNEFLVFVDAEEDETIAVVYRRKDGNYGLIGTGARAGGGD